MPLSRHSVGTYQENELTRNSSGNTPSQSSQLAEPLWTDPGLKRGISVHKLISTLKKKKKGTGREWMVKHFPKTRALEEKATIKLSHRHTPVHTCTHTHAHTCTHTHWNQSRPARLHLFHISFTTMHEVEMHVAMKWQEPAKSSQVHSKYFHRTSVQAIKWSTELSCTTKEKNIKKKPKTF